MVGGVVTTEAGSSPGRAGRFRQGLLPGCSLPIQDRARGTQEGQPGWQLPPLLTAPLQSLAGPLPDQGLSRALHFLSRPPFSGPEKLLDRNFWSQGRR